MSGTKPNLLPGSPAKAQPKPALPKPVLKQTNLIEIYKNKVNPITPSKKKQERTLKGRELKRKKLEDRRKKQKEELNIKKRNFVEDDERKISNSPVTPGKREEKGQPCIGLSHGNG